MRQVRRGARATAGRPRATRHLPQEERFAARLKLAQLPRNSSPVRVRNRCLLTGRPRGYYRKLKMSRIALRQLSSAGHVPGHGQVELVEGGAATMTMSDPLGRHADANPQRPAQADRFGAQSGLATCWPASSMRAAARGLHPRLPASASARAATPRSKIELKYYDGQPVIKRIWRISRAGPPRVLLDQGAAENPERPRHVDSSRPRAASCRTPRRAPPTSAAKSCAG